MHNMLNNFIFRKIKKQVLGQILKEETMSGFCLVMAWQPSTESLATSLWEVT